MPNAIAIPVATPRPGNCKTHGRVSCRRTCDRSDAFGESFSSCGKRLLPAADPCNAKRLLPPATRYPSATPICRRSGRLVSLSLRQFETRRRWVPTDTCDSPCCPPATCSLVSIVRGAAPRSRHDRPGLRAPVLRYGTRCSDGLRPALVSLSAATDPCSRIADHALRDSGRRETARSGESLSRSAGGLPGCTGRDAGKVRPWSVG